VGGRPLQLYLLRGDLRTVLLDTGCAPDPEAIIFPYLVGLGLEPADVDMVVNSHSDLDHCGGNAAMKRAHPGVVLTCGEADRPLIEDPQVMWDRRYGAYAARHAIAPDEAGRTWIMEMLGAAQPVDITWRGGERLRLSHDWLVEIRATPGHSPGHLAIYDPRSRVALTGDAVHGAVYLDTHGRPALCPTYLDVDAYRSTIINLRGWGAEMLAGCHWPVATGPEVATFLDESEEFTHLAERALMDELARRPAGASLRELIDAVGPRLGDWPRAVDVELVYALSGHMDHLTQQGKLWEVSTPRPIRYKAAE
jgi:glyoxylase-like metal-dependent hydrolase (beta-lactamase superfamily II)